MLRRLVIPALVTLLSPVVAGVGASVSQKPEESPQKVEVTLSLENKVIRPGETLKLRVEIWNAGKDTIIIPQNTSSIYHNSVIQLYLKVGSKFQGSSVGIAADGIPESKPDVVRTFVTNWITIPSDHFYGTYVYMDPIDFPQLRTPGRYGVKAEYISGGISPGFAYNAARLNQEDIDKLPFKAWAGTATSNLVTIQVATSSKGSVTKK